MLYASKICSFYEKKITENNFDMFKMWELQNSYAVNAFLKIKGKI